MSIGEVLSLLQDDFPDVTISKIRFLESQGLIDPERTPSGYRKFYEGDIRRLRWILRQQRESFLPLKVIKNELDQGVDFSRDHDNGGAARSLRADDEKGSDQEAAQSAARVAALQEGPPERKAGTAGRAAPRRRDTGALQSGVTALTLGREELLEATGLDEAALDELERYGLIVGGKVGSSLFYDEEAVVIAQLAADFAGHGVEARHLRMYKVAAEREANLIEQLVMHLLKQRNPASRERATETMTELASLGERMRAALLRQALRGHL
ncbi:MAG: MerR family transcriptional regulator [Actinobacteria bacterium]|nr:MAG: MerR family transcriptional regulator [Actinomycetota bacterium]RIK05670.1 MAG: MerR family transcriptional regulator [Acidobacteriota bacterium]